MYEPVFRSYLTLTRRLGGGQSHPHGAVETGDPERCPGTLGATQLVNSKAFLSPDVFLCSEGLNEMWQRGGGEEARRYIYAFPGP